MKTVHCLQWPQAARKWGDITAFGPFYYSKQANGLGGSLI